MQEEEREKAREKRNVFSLDFNTVTESLLTTVLGSEFKQPEQSIGKHASRKASLWKVDTAS